MNSNNFQGRYSRTSPYGHLSNTDTSLIRTPLHTNTSPYGHLSNTDTSPHGHLSIRTPLHTDTSLGRPPLHTAPLHTFTSPYGHLSKGTPFHTDKSLRRTPLQYGQFPMYRQNSHTYPLTITSIIQILSKTDNGRKISALGSKFIQT